MSKIQPYIVQDESGAEYTVYIQTDDVVPATPSKDVKRDGTIWDNEESYGNQPRSTVSKATLVKLREVNGTIRTYAK